jgi:glycerol-3-phosphate dehydrogenase
MQRKNEIRRKATKEHKAPDFDVIIIGGGVIGSLISYQLSKYEIKVCLVDKESDLAMEETSANSAIVHAGYDPEPGSNKAKFNILGNEMMEPLCKALNVPFERNGSIVIAFTPEDKEHLLFLMDRGRTNGVKGLAILSPKDVFKMEPYLSKEILCALFAPSGGIVCPYELTLAASEVAHRNGVEYRFEREVTGIRRMRTLPAYFEVTCSIPGQTDTVFRKPDRSLPEQTPGSERKKEKITCRFVINAAGAFADVISKMAGDDSFSIIPRRGEYIVLDNTINVKVRHTVFQTPSAKGKGVLVTPTVDGNTLVGPNAQPVSDPSDTRTTEEGLNEVFQLAKKSVPSLDRKWMIRSFAGIRSTPSTHDFILGESAAVKGFFQAAGIESPGLTSAPAIAAELERNILEAFSTKPELKPFYSTERKVTVRFRDLPREEQREKIKENPLYAQMICRCEQITEAEVIESIHRPLGARTINGVKLRTRAGMGRCQSGFCLPRLLPILARELGVPEEAVSLFGTGSEMIKGRTRYDR